MDELVQFVSILSATIRLAAPLVLAALGGLFAERSGVIDIAIEAKMLAAAFAAASAASVTGSPWIGLLAGIAAAVALALIHAYACVSHQGNQVVSGMALNILAAGLPPVLATAWFHQSGNTPALPSEARFPALDLPFSALAETWLWLDLLWNRLIGGHNLLVYVAAAAVPLAAFVLYRTRFGLRLRAVGENPAAVDTAGISVVRLRYQALIIGGALSGVAGAYLSIAQGAGFTRDMSAGRGFLALAALIFGRWRPVPTLLACLLFAWVDAIQTRLQGVEIPVIGFVPVQLVSALPYIVTVLLLAGWVGKAKPPRTIGLPYGRPR